MAHVVRVKDDIFGEIDFEIPSGYVHLPIEEYAKRRMKAMRSDDWSELENVRLFDRGTKELMCISSMPYRWRIFVEKV